MQRERRRLPVAFLLSLLLHALLLSLIFHGGQGFGLPSFTLPWQQRWIEVADLHVVLQPAPAAAAAPMPAPAETPASEMVVGAGPASMPSGLFAASLRLRAQPVVSDAAAKTEAKKGSGVPRRAVAAKATLPARETRQAAPAPTPRTAVIALEQSDDKTFVVPPQPTEPTSDAIVAAQDSVVPAPEEAVETLPDQTEATVLEQTAELTEATSTEHEVQRLVQLETARQETERRENEQLAAEKREAARQEAVRAEAERKEAGQLAAVKQEAQRLEAAQQETARAEAARQEADRREAARLATEKQEEQRREAARQEAARAEAARQEVERREAERLTAEKLEAQRREAARQEAARAEAARQEAERREAERLAAEKQEAQRREAARQEAARTEAARQEAERREAERLAAEKQEAQRRETARQEAARAEAARQETERREAERLAAERQEAQRREAARQEAARAEAARQDTERREAARTQADREEDERRLARRRAMGRQLDEEAAQRQTAATANRPPLPLSLSTARRARLWGRSDPNVELVLYAEAWMRRIQLNTPVDTVRHVASRRHTAPMVTVAVRSDGYVESVTIVVSSGVAEVDEAIRRIVTNNVPYPPFPAALSRQYEVLEIRRTWHFDNTLHLD